MIRPPFISKKQTISIKWLDILLTVMVYLSYGAGIIYLIMNINVPIDPCKDCLIFAEWVGKLIIVTTTRIFIGIMIPVGATLCYILFAKISSK